MEEAKQKFVAANSQQNNPNTIKLQNDYNNARITFESTEKTSVQHIKEFEIKKGDYTLVLV